MDKLVHAFQIFAGVIAPWLIASLIPSLIVGLTPYPKASKALKVLSFIGKCLSFVVHSDEAGTFQIPVVSPVMAAMKPKQAGAALALVLAGLMGMHGTGCAWLQAHPADAKAINCGASAVVSALPSILADVAAALSGSSPDWSALGGLEASNGLSAVVCAAEALAENAQPSDAGVKAAINPNIRKSALAYMAARGVK